MVSLGTVNFKRSHENERPFEEPGTSSWRDDVFIPHFVESFQEEKRRRFQYTTDDEENGVRYFSLIPHDHSFARLCASDKQGNELPFDGKDYKLQGKESGENSLLEGNFFVSWTDSYELLYRDKPILQLANLKQLLQIPIGTCVVVE